MWISYHRKQKYLFIYGSLSGIRNHDGATLYVSAICKSICTNTLLACALSVTDSSLKTIFDVESKIWNFPKCDINDYSEPLRRMLSACTTEISRLSSLSHFDMRYLSKEIIRFFTEMNGREIDAELINHNFMSFQN